MMEDLISFLLTQSGVTAAVSNRVYPVQRPQGSALPAISIQRIAGAPESSDEGDSRLAGDRVQVDCWGRNYAETRLASRAVKAALSGRQFSHGGTEFQGIYTDTEADTTENGATPAPVFRTRIDFMVWHKES